MDTCFGLWPNEIVCTICSIIMKMFSKNLWIVLKYKNKAKTSVWQMKVHPRRKYWHQKNYKWAYLDPTTKIRFHTCLQIRVHHMPVYTPDVLLSLLSWNSYSIQPCVSDGVWIPSAMGVYVTELAWTGPLCA